MNGDDVITQATDSRAPGAPAEAADVAGMADGGADVSVGETGLADETDAGVVNAGEMPHRVEVPAGEFASDDGPVSDDSHSDDGEMPHHVEVPAGEFASDDEPVPDDVDSDSADASPAEVRRELLSQFEAWLDRMAEGEPPPEGLPEELLTDALETPEPRDALGSDLYTLFAGLTTLSGEIRLQGRAFKQLADVLAPTAQVPGRLERIESAQAAIARELARQSEADESDLPASDDVLAVLFDLYDRLNRGLQSFDASLEAVRSRLGSGGFLRRMLGGKAHADQLDAPAEAMREGYRLTLSRLEAAFLQWGIQRTGEVGEPFDPEQMAVVDVGTAPGAPDGSILEVYRSGYVLNGRVLATARVKVTRAGPSR